MSLLDIKTIYLQKSAKNYSNYLDIIDKLDIFFKRLFTCINYSF